MDFEADWSLFCRESLTEEVFLLQKAYFNMISIPGQKYSVMETPVTQELYQEVMGKNPSYFKAPQNPVESVSYEEVVVFCGKLSENTGGKFRLPTLEEWEFSALGGLSSFKDFTPLEDYAVFAQCSTAPVKSKKPNDYGLYDMLGNVWEWTSTQGGDEWAFRVRGAYCGNRYNRLLNLGFRCVVEL